MGKFLFTVIRTDIEETTIDFVEQHCWWGEFGWHHQKKKKGIANGILSSQDLFVYQLKNNSCICSHQCTSVLGDAAAVTLQSATKYSWKALLG